MNKFAEALLMDLQKSCSRVRARPKMMTLSQSF